MLTLGLAVSACAGPSNNAPIGEIGAVSGFYGGVAADEPRATLVARDILSAGGSAADAVAAGYFALSVTYPVAASLGGGGVCAVFDRDSKRSETLLFLPMAPAAGGPVAVPGNVRGMVLLHSRYGRLRWEQVLAPAEQLARLGHPISRAFARSIDEIPLEAALGDLADLARNPSGAPRAEGETLRQFDLAVLLSRLRYAGGIDLYTGPTARLFVEAARSRGGLLTVEDMRAYAPEWREPIKAEYDNVSLLFAPTAGGTIAAKLWSSLVTDTGLMSGGRINREDMAQALGVAYAGLPGASPVGSIASTGIAAMDRNGQAVACTVSMGRPFGLSRVAAGTGIVLAPPPGPPDLDYGHTVAMAAANLNVNQAFAAAAASGGAPAAAALVSSLADAMVAKQPLRQAVANPRSFRAGPNAVLMLEPGIVSASTSPNVAHAEVGQLGRVNLLYCADALPRSPGTCAFAYDRRGFGLAAGSMP